MQGKKMRSSNFGFFRSKRFNLKGWKIWDMLRQIGPYLRKYKYLVNEVIDEMWYVVWVFEG